MKGCFMKGCFMKGCFMKGCFMKKGLLIIIGLMGVSSLQAMYRRAGQQFYPGVRRYVSPSSLGALERTCRASHPVDKHYFSTSPSWLSSQLTSVKSGVSNFLKTPQTKIEEKEKQLKDARDYKRLQETYMNTFGYSNFAAKANRINNDSTISPTAKNIMVRQLFEDEIKNYEDIMYPLDKKIYNLEAELAQTEWDTELTPSDVD
jgi:hypothetical protein